MTYKVNERFIHAWKMYKRIPMKSASVLPDEGFAMRPVVITESSGVFAVYCKPKPVGMRWGHRVMVVCPCGKHVPFGRMGQHFNKMRCGDHPNAVDYFDGGMLTAK